MMESPSSEPQVVFVLDFLLFLNETMSRTSRDFEDATACSPDEAAVIRVLVQRGPLMVKEIVQALPGMDASKLTRLLDNLEHQGYAIRSLNRADRRSFLVTPTARGLHLLEEFTQHLRALTEHIFLTLTPIEQLVLVELFKKIQTNWDHSERHPNT
jgi:DNA-binding MarR family transcriptional regulator